MDLGAVKAARRTDLFACAMAAARNAHGLLHDSEVLAERGCSARAYSLAVLAVEECGKAVCLSVLALLPRTMRTRAPAGRLLQWHQLKQVGGLLIAAVTLDEPGLALKLATMPAARAAQIVSNLSAPADDADHLKRRGLYVDMDRAGRIREPSEITDAELTGQLARARQAVASAHWLLAPEARARLANPRREAIALAQELACALTRAGHARTPEAAVDVMLNALREYHITAARPSARPVSRPRNAPRPGSGRGIAAPLA